MKEINMITIKNTICNECKNPPLLYDPRHNEIFCAECGLIHEKNIIPGVIFIKFYFIFQDMPIFFYNFNS